MTSKGEASGEENGSEESEYELEASELRYTEFPESGPSEYTSQGTIPMEDENGEMQQCLLNLNVQHQKADEHDEDEFHDAEEEEDQFDVEGDPDEEDEPSNVKEWEDPLWYGKSLEEIRSATDHEKALGNNESRRQNWKKALFYWKRCLKGAQKLEDLEYEIKVRLNLALGYTKRQKGEKACEHCDAILSEPLLSASTGPLRAKAHYRRADALVEQQEFARAIQELRSVLEIEPQNVDARKRHGEVQELERQYRKREKEMFQGKLGQVSYKTSVDALVEEGNEVSEEKEAPRLKSSTRTTMDRLEREENQKAQNRLAENLTNPHGLNVTVGETMRWG